MGAFLNVKINSAGLKDKEFTNKILAEEREIETHTGKYHIPIWLKIINFSYLFMLLYRCFTYKTGFYGH
jgi:hypothetical protein